MPAHLRKLTASQSSAVTVDWVVMTVAVVGLCIAFIVELRNDASTLSFLTQKYLETPNPAAAAGGGIRD